MKQPEPIRRPARLAYLIPVFILQMQIDDLTLSLIYGFIMASLTARMFPLIEYPKPTQDDKQ